MYAAPTCFRTLPANLRLGLRFSSTMAARPIAIIAGAGPGTGAALSRKFAKEYPVALLARSAKNYEPLVKSINESGGKAIGVPMDATSQKSVSEAFSQIKEEFGTGNETRVAAAIFNVGGRFIKKPFLELSLDDFGSGLDPGSRGAFLFSQAALPLLLNEAKASASAKETHPPTLVFTGATAALKGSAQFSGLASGKFATRAIAQSIAREFGPQGIHVAHAIIDGLINTEGTKAFVMNAPDAKILPEDIADAYWYLHTQPRTAFTHEIDLRPYAETW